MVWFCSIFWDSCVICVLENVCASVAETELTDSTIEKQIENNRFLMCIESPPKSFFYIIGIKKYFFNLNVIFERKM